jgi:hypothetical protein
MWSTLVTVQEVAVAHPSLADELVRAFGAVWVLWLIIAAFVFSIVWPLMALSITMNIRGIRRELRDIAEQLSLPSHRL